ncbi:Aldo/keto reductase [Thelephora ganbajun]|uniref:Aldo/keto reductase n=1 Tax=Thelephora ganbajun TaxID=370292 RepID=A0ACB6Z4D1_THEGA|nr:Aldo/keto reductase [Thelephora ganbajun]
MVITLDSVQIVYNPPTEYRDNERDKPIDGLALGAIGNLGLPELVFGAGNFSLQYNPEEHMTSDVPIRSIRLCMRYGIRAFDTSVYYGPSEIVLGGVLKALKDEFPRDSYKLITKCGRYGLTPAEFDYSPSTIRRSVQRSLERLNTTYLDILYLHDVDMVADEVMPKRDGDHSTALGEDREAYGLALEQESKVWGEGDRKVLEAYGELKRMKEEGLVKNIGITGYPLPTLLRLALLIRQTYGPMDVLMSFCHLTIQNDTFTPFVKELTERAGVGQLLTASPLCMGLLAPNPPEWSPAPARLKSAASEALNICSSWNGGLSNIALGFAYRNARHLGIPTAVGIGSLEQVHETVRVWREIASDDSSREREAYEDRVLRVFDASGYRNYSWPCPPTKVYSSG